MLNGGGSNQEPLWNQRHPCQPRRSHPRPDTNDAVRVRTATRSNGHTCRPEPRWSDHPFASHAFAGHLNNVAQTGRGPTARVTPVL
eukprot:gene22663-biopygen4253